jgi:GNAT superfamily N-acetyltransferase
VTDSEPPVRVRPATPADRDQVWPLARDLATSHLAFHANAPVAWVEEVMVAAPARGTGVGRQLMAAAESWARSIGAAYAALATRRAAPLLPRPGLGGIRRLLQEAARLTGVQVR